jgi:hypothetical protein
MPFSHEADMPTSPASNRPGQASALSQDLDALARPLSGEVIEHQLTSGLFGHLLAAYVPSRPACQETQTPRQPVSWPGIVVRAG